MKKDMRQGLAPNVTLIPATRPFVATEDKGTSERKMRVAAYCRVSTGEDSQQTSYATQKEFYTRLIQEREEWDFVGIYADEALSGTSRSKRVRFNEMMEDAAKGKLDYIITKSISRFARNTLDTLNCVRQLRRLDPPVGIYFEKENIDTLDAKGELILTILSALAQEESRSISENIRWTFQKNFQEGKPHVNLRRMLGYDFGPEGSWIIVEEQAQIVRYIFCHYLHGKSGRRIAQDLNTMGKQTAHGNPWRSEAIYGILRNEKYVGDLEMQKTITKDFLTHRSIPNRGEAPRYYVRDHHPGIISRETWEKVQGMLGHQQNRKGPKASPFKNLRCGCCGEPLRRMAYSVIQNGVRKAYPVWACPRRSLGCSLPVIAERAVEASFMERLAARQPQENVEPGWEACGFDHGFYLNYVKWGDVYGDRICYHMASGEIWECDGNLRSGKDFL